MSCSGGGRIPLTKDECHESGIPHLIAKVKKLIVGDVDDEITEDIDKGRVPGMLKGCYIYERHGSYRVNYNTGNGGNPDIIDRSQQQAICKDRVTG